MTYEEALAFTLASRRRQGLPDCVQDPVALAEIAKVLGAGAREKDAPRQAEEVAS